MDKFSKEIVEAFARAWASIDGKGERFDECKENPEAEEHYGYYEGYMADARELLKRAGCKVELKK